MTVPPLAVQQFQRLTLVFALAYCFLLAIPARAESPYQVAPEQEQYPTGNLSGIVQVATGGGHTCALASGGGILCWGSNTDGQLGDGSMVTQWKAVAVPTLSTGMRSIHTGNVHSCAVTVTGGVKCWGDNAYGQVGDATTSDRLLPTDVAGLGSVQNLAAGGKHTCVVTATGGVKCWGDNTYGQLGDGTTTNRLQPVDVIGLTNGVRGIAAGGVHTCALTVEGGVKCWGYNTLGQLGDGTKTHRSFPVYVYGLTRGVQAISTGASHTCALTVAGAVKCWGANLTGQVGDGTSGTDRYVPVDAAGLPSGARAIAAGGGHTCAITATGGLKCWGNNYWGQVGDGLAGSHRLTAADVSGLASGVQAVALGGAHTCALLADAGKVKCWGINDSGQVGMGGPNLNAFAPWTVSSITAPIRTIAGGENSTCILTDAGSVQCWGWNEFGQLGDNTQAHHWTPTNVSGLTGNVQAIDVGTEHACALTTAGGVKCWGRNQYGQLGDGTTTNRLAPVDVVNLTSGAVAIAVGDQHACALTSAGAVVCWGSNNNGQLGDGTSINRPSPTTVRGLTSGIRAIGTGDDHSCAISATGALKCWGNNHWGQLGDGTYVDRSTPVDVRGLNSGVRAVTGGDDHTCAITGFGGLKCWGDDGVGQLGTGSISGATPIDVVGLTSGVQSVTAGRWHTCALTTSGGAKCWGEAAGGEVGIGYMLDSTSTPIDVVGLAAGVTALAAGGHHTCAYRAADGVKCWGQNLYGQLGVNPSRTPVDVLGPPTFYSLSGKITVSGYQPLAGVTLSIAGMSAVTDAAGQYAISGIPEGSHRLTPGLTGYTFFPQTADISFPSTPGAFDFVATADTPLCGAGVAAAGLPTCAPIVLDLPVFYPGIHPSWVLQGKASRTYGKITSWFDHSYPTYRVDPNSHELFVLPVEVTPELTQGTLSPTTRQVFQESGYSLGSAAAVVVIKGVPDSITDGCNLYYLKPSSGAYNVWSGSTVTLWSGLKYGPGCTAEGTSAYDGHNGIDFSSFYTEKNGAGLTPIRAAAAGTVIKVNWKCEGGYGCYVLIDHGNGFATLYAHLLANSFWVGEGHIVEQGDILGMMGSTGNSTGVHLHFSVFHDRDGDGADKMESSEVIDPYGWFPSYSDPPSADPWESHAGVKSSFLWKYNMSADVPAMSPAGTVQSPTGMVRVEVPANAVAAGAWIEVTELPVSAAQTPYLAAGPSFRLAVYQEQPGAAAALPSAGQTAGEILPQLTMSVGYFDDDVRHVDEARLQIARWDVAGETWQPQPTTVDTQRKVAVAQTSQGGAYSLQGPRLCPADTIEPNDDPDVATPTTSPVAAQMQSFDSAADEDWYRLDAIGGAVYVFALADLSGGVQPVLQIFSGDGATLLAATTGTEPLAWMASADTGYFVRVAPTEASTTGCGSTYRLALTPLATTDHLYLPVVRR